MNKIAIFASGAGSNAQKIIDHFHSAGYGGVPARVVLIISGNPNAGVLKIAGKEGIRALILNKERFQADGYLSQLKDIDLIVLAGFLWKIPQKLVDAFPRRIINIHPALLPKFGGKGMYGHNVHNAVISQQEKETGITIHYVDEVYDNGEIIFQATCSIERSDDANEVARKVHELEHTYYPGVIESVLKVKSELKNNS